MLNKQHQLGQHYSKNSFLIEKYNGYLKELNKIVVDPFCGEGDLLFHYLDLFDFKQQIELLKGKKIFGLDIDLKNIETIKEKMKLKYNLEEELLNELFIVNDSLLNPYLLNENSFILTNPPYLAKNICKKKFKQDFIKYFEKKFNKFNDYFEISLDIYSKYDGLWIVPSNIFSSDNMNNLRKKILHKLENIIVYKMKIFENTDISVSTFLINNKLKNQLKKEIVFINNKVEKIEFLISKKFNLVEEWDTINDKKNELKITQGYLNTSIKKDKVKAMEVLIQLQTLKGKASKVDYFELLNKLKGVE